MVTRRALGFEFLSRLRAGPDFELWRARRLSDGAPALLRVTHGLGRQLEAAAGRLARELRLSRALARQAAGPPLATARALLRGRGELLLVRDAVGAPLDVGAPVQPDVFTERACVMAEALAELHDADMLHRALSPAAFLLAEPEAPASAVFLSELAWTRWPDDDAEPPGPPMGDALRYAAPELVGRMNREADARADLYALGAVFYELLTGAPPFRDEDPLELVHAHVVRPPAAPRRPDGVSIPAPLAAITLRLLAKNPDGRYQSAAALLGDLRRCRSRVREGGPLDASLVRSERERVKLRSITQLYGRDEELEALERALERAKRGGIELVMISGHAGAGKSALLEALRRRATRARVHCVAGRFDAYGREPPFETLLSTLQGLIQHILTLDEPEILSWRERITDAVGPGLGLLTEALPDLGGLLQRPAEQRPSPSPEASNLLRLALLRLIGLFTLAGRILVLALDDLHCADLGTVEFLRALVVHPQQSGLLLVVTYREDALTRDAGLCESVNELAARDDAVTLRLGALSVDDTRRLLRDALDVDPVEVDALASDLHQRTSGNPLFTRELIRYTARVGLLTRDAARGGWSWSLSAVGALPQDLAEVLLDGLRGLPGETVTALASASCLGGEFSLTTLARVLDAPSGELEARLQPASERDLLALVAPDRARFSHEHVRKAVYEQLTADERVETHLAVGRALWGGGEDHGLEALVHLNLGISRVVDERERLAIAALNLEAARQARARTAYASAARLYAAGCDALPAALNEGARALAFALHSGRAECKFLSSQQAAAERHLPELKRVAHTDHERALVHRLELRILVSLGRSREAIAVGRAALESLGVSIPEDEDECASSAAADRAQIDALLSQHGHEYILHRPVAEDLKTRDALELLTEMLAPTNLSRPGLYALVVSRQVLLSLTRGHAEVSAYSYMVYGYYLSTALARHAEGAAIGARARELGARIAGLELQCRLDFVFGSYGHLSMHLRETLALFDRARTGGLEAGDHIYTSYACSHTAIARLDLGDPLGELVHQQGEFLELMTQTKVASSTAVLQVARQLARNLRGETYGVASLSDEGFDEHAFIERIERAGLTFAIRWYYTSRLMALYLHGEFERAAALLSEAGARISSNYGFFYMTEYPFYAALVLAARYADSARARRETLLEELDRHLRALARWAAACPENYEHRRCLVAAERARVVGRAREATELYDRAVAQARVHGFTSIEAIANERAAAFHAEEGRATLARLHRVEARDAYARWGATAKVGALERAHPKTLQARVGAAAARPGAEDAGPLDIDSVSVLRSAQAFAAEIELDRMLERVMHTVLLNAGAERAALIIDDEDGLIVAADADTDDEGGARVRVLGDRAPLRQSSLVASAAVLMSWRTGRYVVRDEARADDVIGEDPYVARVGVRSLLCVPVQHRGETRGVLYLEHNQIAGAFTPARVEVLRLLTAQLAISLSHAQVYARLERARAEAESASRAKSTFLANMSHELRTPLNAIIGYGELMLDITEERGDDELSEDLRRIQRAGKHLLEIISNVLDFSKIEAERLDLNFVPFDVGALLREIVEVIRPVVEARGNVFRAQLGALGDARSDPLRIRQILINVLGNASKFTDDGAVTLTARRDETSEGARLHFEVSDTGIGMSPEQQSRIFEVFHQLDASSTRAHGGSGLGLAITQRLVTMLGGAITVRSAVGEGSTFTIELPASPDGSRA